MVPGSSPQADILAAVVASHFVGVRISRIGCLPLGSPFVLISQHVQRTAGRTPFGEAPDQGVERWKAATLLRCLPEVAMRFVGRRISPGVSAAVGATGSFFPLGFGGKRLAGPPGVLPRLGRSVSGDCPVPGTRIRGWQRPGGSDPSSGNAAACVTRGCPRPARAACAR